jgi:AcrR family transcriptional regulator
LTRPPRAANNRTVVRSSNVRSPAEAPARVRERAEARRFEILRAAARVFRRRGFAATGMREIAAEAGLSPANLYHYFNGKQELLYFCQDRSLDRMLAALDEPRPPEHPIRERLREVLVAHARCLLDEFDGSAAHLEVGGLPPELRQTLVDKRDRYERGVRRLVAEGIGSGEFAPCDPEIVTRAMLGAVNWSARWFRPDGPRRASSVAADLSDYLLRGLAPAPSAEPIGAARAGDR